MRLKHRGMPWLCREKVMHSRPLTDAEKLELAETMAKAREEISRLEDKLAATRKILKEQIDAQAGIMADAARRFRQGLATPEEIACDCYQDFERNEIVCVSVQGGEEISRRPMTPEEKNPGLFFDSGEGNGADED